MMEPHSCINRTGVMILTGILLWALLLALYLPGMMIADSVDMLCQAIHNQYHDWHSPLMSVVWRFLNMIVLGPSLMLVLIEGLFLLGAGLFVSRASTSLFWRIVIMLLLTFWPPILANLGIVSKDSVFLSLYLVFIAIFLGALDSPKLQWWRVAVLILLVLCGSEVRTDGAALFVPPLAVLFLRTVDQSPKSTPARSLSRPFKWTIAGTMAVATIVVCLVLIGGFHKYIVHATPRFNTQVELAFDLAGISVRADQNLMPSYIRRARIDLGFLKSRYTPLRQDPLHGTPDTIRNIPVTTNPREFSELETAWWHAIVRHPLYYLEHRAAVSAYMLGFGHQLNWQLYQPGTDPNYLHYCPPLRSADVQDNNTPLRVLLRDRVMPALLPTPLFRAYSYILVILGAAGWAARRMMVRRGRGADSGTTFILAIAAGAVLHEFVLFGATPGAYFRYQLPTILSALIVVVLAVQSRIAGSKRRAPTSMLAQEMAESVET